MTHVIGIVISFTYY